MLTTRVLDERARHSAKAILLGFPAVAIALGLVLSGAFRGGSPVAASPLKMITQSGPQALPLCHGASRDEAVTRGEHVVAHTSLDEVASVIGFAYRLPEKVPEWVSCHVAEHLEWSDQESQAGGITLLLYGDSYGRAPAMELFIAPPPLKPRSQDAPLDGWEFVPIEGRSGWFQFVLPPEAPALWTEIAWFDDDHTYYRLRGSFTLEAALEIAESVSTKETSSVG